jgi:peptidoglycan/LPS O-acetylase OafA/YrhL
VIRLALALAVMADHFGTIYSIGMNASAWFQVGRAAVLTFFAISGFVITEAAECFYVERPFAFGANRTLRIFPLFILCTLLGLIALSFSRPEAVTLQEFVANITRILPIPDPLNLERSTNIVWVSWTLRYELGFYAFVCMVLWLPARFFRPAMLGTCSMTLALSILRHFFPGPGHTGLGLAPYFTIGVCYYFAVTGSKLGAWLALMSLMIIVFLGLTPLFLLFLLPTSLLAAQALKRQRWDRLIGDFSYPIYLCHGIPLLIPGVSLATAIIASVAGAGFLATTAEHLISAVRTRVRGIALSDAPSKQSKRPAEA